MRRLRPSAATAFALSVLVMAPEHPRAAPTVPPKTVIQARDGSALPLAADRQKWTLIAYWATWCDACIKEFPMLSGLAAEPTLQVIGISDETITPEAWRSFLLSHPRSYPVALVDRRALPAQLSPLVMGQELRPIQYLLDPDGNVVRRFLGPVTATTIRSFVR